jgi:hypothetical protein
MKYLLILTLLVACGKPKVENVDIINGKDGKNGHSLVSESFSASECEDGGSRLDIFLDADDSLDVSEGDLFQSSIIACNGAQGEQGEQGVQGQQGIEGLVGANGAQGVAGPRGLKGPRGPIGPQGLIGSTGAVGPKGDTGATGSTGQPGPIGPQGSQGSQGIQGIQGIQGAAGLPASSCTLVFKPNQGKNGKKYTLTCGNISITFTADEEDN